MILLTIISLLTVVNKLLLVYKFEEKIKIPIWEYIFVPLVIFIAGGIYLIFKIDVLFYAFVIALFIRLAFSTLRVLKRRVLKRQNSGKDSKTEDGSVVLN